MFYTSECYIDANETGCSYDSSTEKLTIYVTVNFNESIYSVSDKSSKTDLNDTVIKFWDCTTNKRRRRGDVEKMLQLERLIMGNSTVMQTGMFPLDK